MQQRPDDMPAAANQPLRPHGAVAARVRCTHDIQPSVVRIGKPANDNRANYARLAGRVAGIATLTAAILAGLAFTAIQLF